MQIGSNGLVATSGPSGIWNEDPCITGEKGYLLIFNSTIIWSKVNFLQTSTRHGPSPTLFCVCECVCCCCCCCSGGTREQGHFIFFCFALLCVTASAVGREHTVHLQPSPMLLFIYIFPPQKKGFLNGSVVKNPPANARDKGSIPGSGRSPGGGNGNPLQYSCLKNPMDRGAWWVHGFMGSQRVGYN